MYMYVPCQVRFSWLCTYVWLPTVSTAFLGDVEGNSELIEKIGVEVDTILKATAKAFDPSLYCLPGDHNIVRGGLSYTSPANQWKLGLETKLRFQKAKW